MEVPLEDRQLLTLNTHKGFYRCTRLLYGIFSALAIWQQEIETILRGIPGVTVFLEDIKITGDNDDIQLQCLVQVFEKLQTFGLRVTPEKSEFFKINVVSSLRSHISHFYLYIQI